MSGDYNELCLDRGILKPICRLRGHAEKVKRYSACFKALWMGVIEFSVFLWGDDDLIDKVVVFLTKHSQHLA